MYIFIYIFFIADRFSSVGSTTGNISSGQVLQYESSSCFVDGSYKYEEYHESYMKIDGSKTGKDEYKESKGFAVISAQGYDLSHFSKADEIRRKKLLNNSYGSFKGLKEDRRDSQENNLKSGRSRLVPSVSFNDKILSASAPKGKLAVFRLSFKRKSGDIGEEASEHCKYSSFCCTTAIQHFFINVHFHDFQAPLLSLSNFIILI
jgi:hypothetical protein